MAGELKVMSFNIRFDNPNEDPEDQWEVRKGACIDIITKYRPHLLGLQEPHQNQVDEIDAALEGYNWFGRGRYLTFFGINEEHNELNPVIYDSAVLTLEASGTFWYSDTPDVPNSKWGCSAFPRIATWGRFTVKESGERLCFVNTHFDHESEEARTRAAELLLEMVPYVSQGLPTVVVGDLNAGESSPAHAKLSGPMVDCGSGVCEVLPGMLGDVGTFVGFDKTIDSKIDFIFANKGFKPAGYGTIPDERPNGRCCSDHRPIMATLSFDPAYTIPDPPPGPPACLTALASTAGSIGEKTSEASVKAEQVARVAYDKAGQAARVAADKTEQAARVAYDKAGQAARVAADKTEKAARVAAVEAKKAARVVGDKAELLARDAAAQAEEKARLAKAEAERLVTAAAEQAVNALGNLFKSL